MGAPGADKELQRLIEDEAQMRTAGDGEQEARRRQEAVKRKGCRRPSRLHDGRSAPLMSPITLACTRQSAPSARRDPDKSGDGSKGEGGDEWERGCSGGHSIPGQRQELG
ncbi:hypothetical protein WMY93_003924 [Mugilogobius chulae]|uniref:Uncharacterized protein n=1 Tax=Mugilogobius chulae TaxID=88201 RepID=A0AAW0PY43_9GOBI